MSLSFKQQMDHIVAKTRKKEEALFNRVTEHVGTSIRFGSATTGAPGQPVKTGRLLKSWHKFGSVAHRLVTWSSRCPYAAIIEDNLRGATLRSKVGGFHSVKLTRLGFRNIVRYEMERLGGTFAVRDGGAWRSATTGRFTKAPR